jgi:1,4-dihydroxy-2-naphthoate polyprenyltransferase
LFTKYIKMVRLHIIIGGLLAFSVGALLGLVNGGVFNPIVFVVCYATVFFGDLSTHFSNDYFDVKQDKGRHKKSLFSNRKILTDNSEMLPTARKIAVALLATSLLISALAVVFQIAPLSLLLIMIGANFLGWFYSSPPLHLSSKGLGEMAIALAVGFAIPSAGYLSSKGAIDSWYAIFAVPFILYALMIALSLEAPDIEGDRLGDKKTLGVTKGAGAVYVFAFFCALSAFLVFLYFSLASAVLPVNLLVITAFSCVPLTAGIFGLLQIRREKNAQTTSAVNVVSLFIINLLILGYLIVMFWQ